ncbi:hypothetical protein MMC25_005513 [Agyrium rufum]|nr:hypothetical protein [Agyrium rufum]
MSPTSSHFQRSPPRQPNFIHVNAPIETPSEMFEDTGLAQRRTAIRRQLRFLFVYPLSYLLLYIIPLVTDCLQYSKSADPPFILSCIAIVSLSLQSIVSCIIFISREKPWRHIDYSQPTWSLSPTASRSSVVATAHTRTQQRQQHHHPPEPTLLKSLRFWTIRISRPEDISLGQMLALPPPSAFGRGAGQSKSAMMQESMMARERREQEARRLKEEITEKKNRRGAGEARCAGSGRTWWEVEGRWRNDSVLLGTDQEYVTAESEKGNVWTEKNYDGRKGSTTRRRTREADILEEASQEEVDEIKSIK